MEYQTVWLGLRRGTFTHVRWQIRLCDHIWQVTLRISEMGFHEELVAVRYLRNLEIPGGRAQE